MWQQVGKNTKNHYPVDHFSFTSYAEYNENDLVIKQLFCIGHRLAASLFTFEFHVLVMCESFVKTR